MGQHNIPRLLLMIFFLSFPALQVCSCGEDEVQYLLEILVANIDLEESREQGRLVIQFGIHDQLDQMKNTLDGLDSFLVCTALFFLSF